MKQFDVKLVLLGSIIIEDPHCPSQWHGSGCYDIPVKFRQSAHAIVFAESKDLAVEKIKSYDFEDQPDYDLDIKDVTILSINEVKGTQNYYDSDVDISYSEPDTNI